MHDLQEETSKSLEQRRKRRGAATGFLLAVVLLGTALRLYQLDADSLWHDEMLTSRKSQQDFLSVITYSPLYTHPPLVDVVTWLFTTLSGNSDFVVRAQAMLFGSLSILLTYKVGQMLWTREVGMIGAFLLALNAYHIRYSQEARSYALMPFLALLSLIFLLKALKRNSKGFWIGFTVCTSLSLYNHYFALFFLTAEVIFAACVITEKWLCHQRKNRRALADPLYHRLSALAKQALPLGVSLAIVCLSFIPWLPALRVHLAYFPDVPRGTDSIVAGLEKSLGLLRAVLVDYCGADVLALLLWVSLFVLGLAACDRARLALVASWVAAPFVFLAVAQSGIPAKQRTVIFLLPLCLIVVARGITSAARSLGARLPRGSGYRRRLAAVIASLGMLLILASVSLASVKEYYLWEKKNWRDAARYLEDSIEPGDIILTDGITYQPGLDANYIRDQITYYLSSDAVETTSLLTVQKGLSLSLQESAPARGRVWAVVTIPSDTPEHGNALQQVSLQAFKGVLVLGLRQASGDQVQDTTSILESLLVLMRRPHPRFDVHLALAEIHAQQGRLSQAASELMLAHLTAPDHDKAETDLAEVSGRLAPVLDLHLDQITFGEEFYSPGYRLYPPTPTRGERITVSFWWRALRAIDRDYTLFIHLVGPDGRIWAQEDDLLEHAGLLTSAWPVRRLIETEYQFNVPADASSGQYAVHAGLYSWETEERLAVWDGSGQRLPGDSMVLGHISITD